ncbi:MAG: M28 family peptidase [Microbacteriaceae bacterium]|nr:M28 family peptidase [Microbacteriaceae bacterium]
MTLLTREPAKRPRRLRRLAATIGAAALAVPLLLSTTAATAAEAPPAATLPSFEQELLDRVDSDRIWEHDVRLSVDIGPRVAGSPAEEAAAQYIQEQLDSFGFTTEIETFDARVQTYADLVPSRTTDEPASWQLRPASNGAVTGPDAPIVGDVIDIGAATDLTGLGVDGRIVVADWIADTTIRTALLADLDTAGAAAVVLVQTSGSESLPNPRELPAELAHMVVVAGATNQGERIRALLADGPLELSITTERTSGTSSNVIGVLPAANGDENAPIVYIGAHFDSVLGSPGASDNGSGVSIMLELARILGQYAFDTEIRIGAWGAEEVGIVGSRVHAESLTAEEIERTIGAWNMDMAGTAHEGTPDQPFGFWALTVDGDTAADNAVLDHASTISELAGNGELQIGQVGRSDHQSFRDVGIEAAVFSWMYWAGGTSIVLEPAYHTTIDTLDLVSQERMGLSAQIIGGSVLRAALNAVEVDVIAADGAAAAGAPVLMRCEGDEGWRDAGTTRDDGALVVHVPAVDCAFAASTDDGARGETPSESRPDGSTATIALELDTTAPTTSIDIAPATTDQWRTEAATATITAVDDRDASPSIDYSLDGTTWLPYEGPLVLDTDGVHELRARSTDTAGNVSEIATASVAIDTAAPEITAVADEPRGRVVVDAHDATSGVAAVEYRIGGGDWQRADVADPASFTIDLPIGVEAVDAEFRAVDAAGNASAPVTVAFAAQESEGAAPAPTPLPTESTSSTPSTKAPELATTGTGQGLAGQLAAIAVLIGLGTALLARRGAARTESGDSA